MPQVVLKKIRRELELSKPEDIPRAKLILAEKYLDQGYGQCFLRNRAVAEIVRDTLLRFDGEQYHLFAWVIMPNHVHTLLRPLPGFSLAQVAHSFKSYTALQSNRVLGRKGPFWMREPFDRYMRDVDHFNKTVRYIENNPVKAGLCVRPEDWEFSSVWSGTPAPCRRV